MKSIVIATLAVATLACFASAKSTSEIDAPPGFEGTYTLECVNLTSGESYTEEVKIYGPMSGTYVVECTYGDDFESGDGFEFNDMLFAYNTAIGYPLSVYKKEGSELYGLVVTEDGEIIKKASKGKCDIVLSPIDSSLAGTYWTEGAADDGSIPYVDTMILEPAGEMWEASQVVHTQGFEDQPGTIESLGSGFEMDQMLVLCHYGGDYYKVYDVKDGALEGRWIVYYWDVDDNGAVVTTGWEYAQKLETD